LNELDNVALYLDDSCPLCRSRTGVDDCGGERALPPGGWSRLLSIAQAHGWDPAGTEPPVYEPEYFGDDPEVNPEAYWHGDPSEWDGRYWPGYGQAVTAKDALELAAALERAWPDLPEHGTFEKKIVERAGVVHILNPEVTLGTTPLELYSGAWRETLRGLAACITQHHCGECAGFWIWSHEQV
jgi:hypothetical protein